MSIVNIATTSSSFTLPPTGIGLIVIPISTGIACGFIISKKVVYEIVKQKNNQFKKQYQKAEQTMKSFDKLFEKSLQGNVIDKREYASLCNFFTKYFDPSKK